MFSSDEVIPRVKIDVIVSLTDGSELRGSFFTSPQQRLIDLMNDPRSYLPFELEDHSIRIFNKSTIGAITPVEQGDGKLQKEKASKWQSTFAKASMEPEEAYKILGLQPGATEKEIQGAKKRLLGTLHPDKGGSTYLASKVNQAVVVLIGS
ncbi:MAG: hypothetical protein OEY85_14610 [Rhodospirillales bacterium]|nr:hypothetical protein [Rhodospirillales bacterium]